MRATDTSWPADFLDVDIWHHVIQSSSVCTLSDLIGTSRTLRDAVTRCMARATVDGQSIRLNADQTWARISFVLLRRSLFLTGGGGVGKTAVTKVIVHDLEAYYDDCEDPDGDPLDARERIGGETSLRVSGVAGDGSTSANEVGVGATDALQMNAYTGTQTDADVGGDTGPPRVRVLCVAPTARAALLMPGNATTIHFAFNLSDRRRRSDGDRVLHGQSKPMSYLPMFWTTCTLDVRLRRRLTETDVLVIDEVSMVDLTFIDMIDRVARIARQCQLPFGGMRLLLVGDFCQLAPIVDKTKEHDDVRHGFAFESAAWQALSPVVVNLTKSVRHERAAQKWIELLHRARFGATTDADHDHLRKNGHVAASGDPLPLLLGTRKQLRDERNLSMLARETGRLYTRTIDPESDHFFQVCVGETGPLTRHVIDASSGESIAVSSDKTWSNATAPTCRPLVYDDTPPRSYQCRVGTRVTFKRNIRDPSTHDIVAASGMTGTVERVDEDAHGRAVVVFVRVDKRSIDGDKSLVAVRPVYFAKIQSFTCRIITPDDTRDVPCRTVVRQFALDVAYAMSIHCSQGASLYEPSDLMINKTLQKKDKDGTFPKTHGLIYTALSRFANEGLIHHTPMVHTKMENDKQTGWVRVRSSMIFKKEDVFCAPVVKDFYQRHGAATTPAWVHDCAPAATACSQERTPSDKAPIDRRRSTLIDRR